jgi:transcriptional accessory protein Tex/SPT6
MAGYMIHTTTQRTCLSCDKNLKGRTDKKFCDDYCRNNYNNQLKTIDISPVRNINNALGKNRRILMSFFSEGQHTAKAARDELLQKGYQFKYSTHTYTNKKGKLYFFCYDYGYLPLENNYFLLVKSPAD